MVRSAARHLTRFCPNKTYPPANPLPCKLSGLRRPALQAGCRWFETGIGHHHNPLCVFALLAHQEQATLKALREEPAMFEGITGAVARAAGEEARD